jgi:epoxyqueuosine reductase
MSLSSGDGSPTVLTALASLLESAGFSSFGFAELKRPLSIGLYEEWLAQGYQGEMSYLERHLPDKKDPSRLLKKARSAIVVTKNYVPHPEPVENFPLSHASRVAAYARGRDYHHFLRAGLTRVVEALKRQWPNEEFLTFTDSGPVLERDLAHRAGLGWVGKNTCLIDKKQGSLFLLAEIYTTLELPVAKVPSPDHCGTCERCLRACPTGALKGPRELDARLCISYLTIESREVAPEPLREKIGDWLFGCDICQTVCPWNIKALGHEKLSDLSPPGDSTEELVKDLRFLLTSSNRALERAFQGTPLLRTGAVGLKRNAMIVAANQDLKALAPEIEPYLSDTHPSHAKLGALAAWALQKLGAPTET